MAGKKSTIGPSGETAASNITRLREDMNLSYAELSRRLTAAGQPIPELGLRNIEKLQRKIDVDELVALAYVLGTTPSYLLLPEEKPENVEVSGTGTSAMGIEDYWWWLTSRFDPTHRRPGEELTAQQIFDRLVRSRPAFDMGDYLTWKFDGDS